MTIMTRYTHDPLWIDGHLEGPGWYAEVRDGQGKLVRVTRIVSGVGAKFRVERMAQGWIAEHAEDVAACC